MFNDICLSLAIILIAISSIAQSYRKSWIIDTFHKLKYDLATAKTDEEKEKARKRIDAFIDKYLKV